MQTASIMLALAGDTGNTIPKYDVTPAEIAVLRVVHGEASVFDIEPGQDIARTNREELLRLNHAYATARVNGTDLRAVPALFPGAAARVFESFDELDLPEEQFKAQVRVTSKSKPAAPKAAKAADAGLAGMSKAELVAHAETNDIAIDATAKKADIIAAIEAASVNTDETEDDGVGDMDAAKSPFA